MRIKEVMNKAVAVEHDISIKEAAKIMSNKNIGSLIAVKGSKILGIITEKDVVDNITSLDKKVSSLMNKKVVVTISPEEDTDNAALLMAKNKIKRLPVVEDGVLIGIITATDLIAHSEDLNESFFFD